jgi:hypothetical protein
VLLLLHIRTFKVNKVVSLDTRKYITKDFLEEISY